MADPIPQFNVTPEKKKNKLNPQMREMIFLAEQAGTGGIKVLPGSSWAYHFRRSPEERKDRLEGLLSGKYNSTDAEEYLKPDALIYDANDLITKGLESVSSRIMNETSMLTYYDYKKYGDFMTGLQGLSISPEKASELYEELTKGRIQKSLRDALSSGGRRSLDKSFVEESERIIEEFNNTDRTKKVINSLKLDWLHQKMGIIDSTIRDQAVSKLSEEERKIYDDLKDNYRDFVDSGDNNSYDKLVKQFKNGFPKLQREVNEGGSESMKELEKELDKMEDVNPPGTERDPAIPPEDNDEYHTPSGDKENQGKQEKGPADYFFKIEPPLAGYYASGKKSYFDIDRKVWSKRKQLSSYTGTNLEKKEVYKIEGSTKGGVVSIPLPTGYAIDVGSIDFKGEKPKIARDQNGCFYIETTGLSSFTISFSKEEEVFVSSPVKEDTEMLYRGLLSAKSESFMARVIGGPLQKAEQIRQHILSNHFYPGGGDLALAQKVQAKLRNETTGDNYIQTIDTSEYLECYSANTKFVAMLRKCGVPSRLVVGHHVEGSQKGKSYIDSNNGHAWAEVWDGKSWRRFDATPPAKPEDKKDDGDKDDTKENAPNASDGGVDSPQEKQKQEESDQDGKKGESGDGESSDSEKSGEATDQDVQQGEQKVQQAQEAIKQAEKNKQEAIEQIEKADSFKDLEKLKEELKEKDLLDEMKETLEDAIEAKENVMKEELKDQLEKMSEDGFLEDEERKKLLEKLLEGSGQELDKLQKEIEEGNALYVEYEKIKEEIEPLVEEWFNYFIDKLPRQKEVSIDEDSLSRQGSFDRRSVNKIRNILFGTVKNPRVIDSSIRPLFLASIMVDVSGSMAGEKLTNAQKLLIFYSELFTRIKEEFGYIKFAINIFSDSMQEIKTYEQDYDSAEAYTYSDNTRSTVKVRLMKNIQTKGGTNMLDPIKRASQSLSEQTFDNPDYASSFYFVGDGGDTCGNGEKIKQFLLEKNKYGFGEHMLSAILLGSSAERDALGQIFGDEHTTVASDFDELIRESMERFDDDIEEYLRDKTSMR